MTATQPGTPATATPTTPTSQGTATALRTWIALLSMTTTSFVLVSAEFLPGGLLTSMAADLGVSPGLAGQAVTATAVAGFFGALFVGPLAPGLDRRRLLVAMAIAAAVSNAAVALAPSLPLLLVARLLLGAALSGFWSMSLTVAASIVGADRVGRGMMMVNAGTMLATVLGVPAGVLLAGWLDWRVVFALISALTLLVAVGLRALLPSVPAEGIVGLAALGETLRIRGMRPALVGHVLVVFGQMAAYAFIRVALEKVPDLDGGGVATLLLVYGLGGFVGNLVLGWLADRMLGVLSLAVPTAIAVAVTAVALWPQMPVIVLAVALWGSAFGGWLVVLNTWVAHHVPDRLETGASLSVAGFQLAIAAGAAVGGILVDSAGITTTLLVAAAVALIGGVLFWRAPARYPATAAPTRCPADLAQEATSCSV
ncbi:MFS transporter [Nocardioides sp.]|uniref:MFS transporter n=1 Tax=Nocardioides sp. TaxID=35761 RepID=UPI00262E47BC|nr:MFS transporter [Nocardioides sp.]